MPVTTLKWNQEEFELLTAAAATDKLPLPLWVRLLALKTAIALSPDRPLSQELRSTLTVFERQVSPLGVHLGERVTSPFCLVHQQDSLRCKAKQLTSCQLEASA